MARFCGNIGFYEEVETSPDVYDPTWTIKRCKGDITVNNWRNQSGEKVNDDVTITNRISIIAAPYTYKHLYAIKWVEWAGTKWKVTGIEVDYPRITLTLGGVWNDGGQET